MGRARRPKYDREAGLVIALKSTLRILSAESELGRLPPLRWWRFDGSPKIVSAPGGVKRFAPSDTAGIADFGVAVFMKPRLWLEAKSDIGRQSQAQKQFQSDVEAVGEIYRLVRTMNDVAQVLRDYGIEHWSLSLR